MRALSQTFDEAVVYALDAHADQRRKGTQVPYASHPLAVASIVLGDGGDEASAIPRWTEVAFQQAQEAKRQRAQWDDTNRLSKRSHSSWHNH